MPSEMEKKIVIQEFKSQNNITKHFDFSSIGWYSWKWECKRVSEPSPFGVLINTARLSKYLPNIYLMYWDWRTAH